MTMLPIESGTHFVPKIQIPTATKTDIKTAWPAGFRPGAKGLMMPMPRPTAVKRTMPNKRVFITHLYDSHSERCSVHLTQVVNSSEVYPFP